MATNQNNKNFAKGDNIKLLVSPYWQSSGATGTYNSWIFRATTGQHKLLSLMRTECERRLYTPE